MNRWQWSDLTLLSLLDVIVGGVFSWVMFDVDRSPGLMQTARRSGHDEESDAEQGANSAFKLFDLDQIWHPFNRGKCDQ